MERQGVIMGNRKRQVEGGTGRDTERQAERETGKNKEKQVPTGRVETGRDKE